jgi:BirA family biotin operon repressor/biotin-[acetyl-CoA-carboxylase] ligase
MLVGVGVNVNSQPGDFPPDIAPVLTTLAHEHKRPCDVGMLQVAVVKALRQLPDIDLDGWIARFRERDCTGGARYNMNYDGRQIYVTAQSVADDGSLLLRDERGHEHRVAAFTDLERA